MLCRVKPSVCPPPALTGPCMSLVPQQTEASDRYQRVSRQPDQPLSSLYEEAVNRSGPAADATTVNTAAANTTDINTTDNSTASAPAYSHQQ